MSPAQHESGEENYEIHARSDLLAVFEALVKGPVPLTVGIDQLGLTANSRLLAMDPAFDELVFDATGINGAESLDGSAAVQVSTQIDAVWYRFEAEYAQAIRRYAHPAFRARMPSTVLRMQRRDSIRYPVPAHDPPICEIRMDGIQMRFRVIDISLSGAALAIDGPMAACQPGSELKNCLLQLPDSGSIQTDLFVAYDQANDGAGLRRLGCRFTNILATSLGPLQSYISRLEFERLARKG